MAPYLRIVADIRAAIERGELQDGDPLPSLKELMTRYGVAESTAGKAVRRLVAEGLASSQPGVGTWARVWRPILRVIPGRFEPGPDTINERDTVGRRLEADVVIGPEVPPANVAELLGLEAGVEALKRRRLFTVDGRPVQIGTSWIPLDIAPEALLDVDTGSGGMWGRLGDVGHAPTGDSYERWRVRMSTDDERRELDLPPGSRVLDGIRPVFDKSGRCVDVTCMVLAESAYELEFHFTL